MNVRLSAASLAILSIVTTSLVSKAGPFDAWSYEMNVTVSGYKEYKPLTNFPILVELGPTRSGFSYSQFGSPSAADLRFTDATGTNELSYEIDTWNPSGNSYVWVRLPVLNGTGTTNFWNGQYVHQWSWSGQPFLAQKTAGGVYWLDRRPGTGAVAPTFEVAQFLRNDGFHLRTSYQFADADPAGGWTYASRNMNTTRTFSHNQYLGDFATVPPTPVYAMIYNGHLYAELRWNNVSPGEFWGPGAVVNVGVTNVGDQLQFADFDPRTNPPNVYDQLDNTNTQPTVIHVYWGNPAASQPAYATNGSVWSGGGWQSVWHMDETAAIDSRARANVGVASNITVTTGRIGSGLGFNPASQSKIDFGTYSFGVLSNYSYAIEGWFYRTGVQGSGEDANISYGSSSTRTTAGLGVQSDGHYKSIHYGDNKSFDYASYASGQWQYIVLVHMGRDGDAGGGDAYMDHLWVNGEFMSMSGNGADKSIQHDATRVLNLASSAPLMFGKASWDGTYCGAQTMDEIRISKQFRDTCWIRASYLTVASNSSFQVYGSVSNGTGGSAFNPTLVASGATWKYHATNSAPSGSWTATNFDDSAWGSGPAAFGYIGSGESEVLTQLPYGSDSTNKWITTYYRTTFNLTNVADVAGLLFSIKIDDGAVWYLNGTERGRINMYEGSLSFTNRTVGGAINPPRPWNDFQVATNGLKVGVNVIAVEVHQQKPDTSDLFFDLSATAVGYATTNQSASTATPGTNPAPATAANWTAYNDMGWLAGQISANITTNSSPTVPSGYLINYLTGSNLPVQVGLSLVGNSDNGTIFSNGFAPPSGSDADLVFGGKVDCSSYCAIGVGTMTMQFTGLDPAQRYSFAMYGSRGDSNYTYRWSTVTLSGVNSFSNSSSAGSTITTTSLAQDTTKILAANMDGKLFRYDIIDPGSDGAITLTIVPAGSGSTNGYLNAFMLGTNSVPTSSGGSGSSNPPPATSGGSVQQLPRNASWHYLNNGSGLVYKPWTDLTGYDDGYWFTGVSPFGYSATNSGIFSSIQTLIGYGPLSTNKYTTYYFRRSFLVSNATALGTVTFNARLDDGAVVYINTNEVYRYNMPAGVITNGMLAVGGIGDATNLLQFTAPSSVFHNGTNLIAVEVHQVGAGSSDIFLDLWSDNLSGPEPMPAAPAGASSYIVMDSGWFSHFYNNNPTSPAVLANLDTDGDGQSGWEEYIAGTDPNNAASEFAITGLRQTNGMNRLVWTGGTNGTLAPYTILFTTNVITGPWVEVAAPNRVEGQNTYDLTPGSIPKGYYKIRAGN